MRKPRSWRFTTLSKTREQNRGKGELGPGSRLVPFLPQIASEHVATLHIRCGAPPPGSLGHSPTPPSALMAEQGTSGTQTRAVPNLNAPLVQLGRQIGKPSPTLRTCRGGGAERGCDGGGGLRGGATGGGRPGEAFQQELGSRGLERRKLGAPMGSCGFGAQRMSVVG